MKTKVSIDGTQFRINGELTYNDADPKVHGLLFNSRMIQAIFDDECPETRDNWNYPDTGTWDAERNTDEFCAMLPTYREHGLLAFTVGLEGGGSIYSKPVYDQYYCSTFTPQGDLKPAYLNRLNRILKTADELGMVAIVNFFYWQHTRRLENDDAIRRATRLATEWLIDTGYQNILIDVVNESTNLLDITVTRPENVHELIEIVQSVKRDGRHIPCGASTGGIAAEGGAHFAGEKWLAIEDYSLPHGNDASPEQLKEKILAFKNSKAHQDKPRPILVNEDSMFLDKLDAALELGTSWGYYSQGFGSDFKDCLL